MKKELNRAGIVYHLSTYRERVPLDEVRTSVSVRVPGKYVTLNAVTETMTFLIGVHSAIVVIYTVMLILSVAFSSFVMTAVLAFLPITAYLLGTGLALRWITTEKRD